MKRHDKVSKLNDIYYPIWNQGVIKVLSWNVHCDLAMKETTDLTEDLNAQSPFSWICGTIRSHYEPAAEARHSDVQTMARLSQIDGAVIFHQQLEPVAFAAKLKSLPECKSLPESCEDFLKSKGMRHRSTAIAVHRMGGGIGITISEDGDVTLFSQREGKELRSEVLSL